ncbi:hypothetical protein T10_3133 [Trichinella papuae]|uniref:Uncharacterized protein n=1 Tax=Trichinella papuae TaxID=268474 RepID=A0A0V1MGW7_9BILA|nr:hypothetical protein T10_3133 [Trichinella papuae]
MRNNINSRENFCFLNVMKSRHSKTCLPENVCRFLIDCYAYAYVASDSMVVGVWCTGRVQWRGIAKVLKKLCKYKMYLKLHSWEQHNYSNRFLLNNNGMDQLSATIISTKSNKQRLSKQNSINLPLFNQAEVAII